MVNTKKSASNEEATDDTTTFLCDDPELLSQLGTLSAESRTLVQVLTKIIFTKIGDRFDTLEAALVEKDREIKHLTSEVNGLKDKVDELETTIDSVDQYERRDTIILSGSALPQETAMEITNNTVIKTIKDNLQVNIKDSDISISHRLGQQKQQKNRPIIVKLLNRSLKQDLVGACVRMKPNLYINESLTPRRRVLFNTVLHIRRTHKQKFQQCFTKDGKIIIKLRNSAVKHTITDEKSLMSFLEKYPEMSDTYRQMTY